MGTSSAGERLGRYELLFKIASGGMGTVHLARMRGSGDFMRLFAIKRVHPHLREDEELTQSLLHEAAIAGRIRHPNVVPVLDAVDENGETFVVMEYVEGSSLAGIGRAAAVQGEYLPTPFVLKVADDMLAGLTAAHELVGDDGQRLGVVHRDVSPHNVLVGVDGIARLTDFGIAKVASRPKLTQTGVTKGKVAYMAPEQARGEALDGRADIWSAAVVIWEMFTGERLYGDSEDIAVALAVIGSEPRRLRSLRPDLSAELEDAIHGALQRRPDDRYASAAELRDRLRVLGEGATLASNAEVAAVLNRYAGDTMRKRRARIEEASREMAVERSDTAPMATVRETPMQFQPTVPDVPSFAASERTPIEPRSSSRLWIGGVVALAAITIGAVGIGMGRGKGETTAPASSAAPIASQAEAPPVVEPPPSPPPTTTPVASVTSATSTAKKRATSPPPKGTGKKLLPNPYHGAQ